VTSSPPIIHFVFTNLSQLAISKISLFFDISSQSSPKEVSFVILAIPLVSCTPLPESLVLAVHTPPPVLPVHTSTACPLSSEPHCATHYLMRNRSSLPVISPFSLHDLEKDISWSFSLPLLYHHLCLRRPHKGFRLKSLSLCCTIPFFTYDPHIASLFSLSLLPPSLHYDS